MSRKLNNLFISLKSLSNDVLSLSRLLIGSGSVMAWKFPIDSFRNKSKKFVTKQFKSEKM